MSNKLDVESCGDILTDSKSASRTSLSELSISEDGDRAINARTNRTKSLILYLSISTLCLISIFLFTLPGSPISLTYLRYRLKAEELQMAETSYFSSATSVSDILPDWDAQGYNSWMSQLPDTTALTAINMPGTHDSTARYGGSSYTCQSLSLANQLDIGVRFFDIRLMLSDGRLTCQHGRVSQKLDFDQVLTEMDSFLEANPSETVILKVQQEHTRYFAADFGSSVESAFSSYSRIFSASSPIEATSVPTLGSLRGKMVLLPRFYDLTTINTIAYEAMTAQDDFKADIDNKRAAITSFYKDIKTASNATEAVFQKRHFHSVEQMERMQRAKALGVHWYINYFSLHNNVESPRDAAYILNPIIADLVPATWSNATTTGTKQQLKNVKRKTFGVVMMDFIGLASIRLIVESNF